jgi:hypothetical protein
MFCRDTSGQISNCYTSTEDKYVRKLTLRYVSVMFDTQFEHKEMLYVHKERNT